MYNEETWLRYGGIKTKKNNDTKKHNDTKKQNKCVEKKTKKYRLRNSPPFSAQSCPSQIKKGKDATYVSRKDKRGIYRWVPISSNKKEEKGKGEGKKYNIRYNGDIPFVVFIQKEKQTSQKAHLYKQKWEKEQETFIQDKKLMESKPLRLFVGDNDMRQKNYLKKGPGKGNTILLETKKGKYVYIGGIVYDFTTPDGDTIQKYESPIGNSDVPYPYAVGEKYVYFMLDRKYIEKEKVDLKGDVYGQFYHLPPEEAKNLRPFPNSHVLFQKN
jgi:hypothetical protein